MARLVSAKVDVSTDEIAKRIIKAHPAKHYSKIQLYAMAMECLEKKILKESTQKNNKSRQ